jgi:uncharacterized protein
VIGTHSVSTENFDALALGYGGSPAISELWRGQCSRRLLLLRLLVEKAGPDADNAAAVATIIESEERDEAARQVLIEPLVGVWAARTIRNISKSTVTKQETAHLAAVAAAAAINAGADAELPGYARDGWLYLPAIGRVRALAGDGRVRLTVENGRLRVDGAQRDPEHPDWQERRRLTAGNLTVFLEDLDPYRNAYHVPPADRLSPSDFDVWRRQLDETWSILTELAPGRAAEVAEGLHSLVPLSKPEANAAHSATTKEAVGVVGLDLPKSPADFAVALVHEFQHSKLSALLDIVALYDGSDQQTFFAPWRVDPRPVGGLLQGVYAFLGVADLWRVLSSQPQRFPSAEQEFADARAQVTDAISTLTTSGLLTRAGQRFVEGMTEAVTKLHATGLPAARVTAAERALASRRAAWLKENR